MLVDLEVFYLGHLKNLYTIQYNTIPSTTVTGSASNLSPFGGLTATYVDHLRLVGKRIYYIVFFPLVII